MTTGHRPRVVACRRLGAWHPSRYQNGRKTPPDTQLRRNDPERAELIPSGQRAWHHRLVACRLARCPSRAAIPTPACTCFSLPRRTRARQGRSHAFAACGRPLHGAVPARLDGRRFGGVGTPPGSRYTAGAGGGIRVAASLCRLPSFINGGGCAAAVLNQWKRLRRSEYQGGPDGRFQHGHPRCRTCWTVGGNARRVLGDADARRRGWPPGRRRPWAAPRRPPVAPRIGADAMRGAHITA